MARTVSIEAAQCVRTQSWRVHSTRRLCSLCSVIVIASCERLLRPWSADCTHRGAQALSHRSLVYISSHTHQSLLSSITCLQQSLVYISSITSLIDHLSTSPVARIVHILTASCGYSKIHLELFCILILVSDHKNRAITHVQGRIRYAARGTP